MSKLVIFDIDGTLVNSSKVDEDCFVQCMDETFGIRNVDTRWEMYENATDSSIFAEIYERSFGKKPTHEETRKQIENFLRLLRRHHGRNPSLFEEVSGAREMLQRLARDSQWMPAIATGTWKEAALFKLMAAGLDVEGIPLATASDAPSREAIMKKCIAASKEKYGVTEFKRIVSVGDAIWDAVTARNLRLPFIRIGPLKQADGFHLPHILENFCETELFIQYLEEATVPSREQ